MKYRVYRKFKISGRVEVLRTKCSNYWVSKQFLEIYPERVWQFSQQGAKEIVERSNRTTRNYEYWMEPVEK